MKIHIFLGTYRNFAKYCNKNNLSTRLDGYLVDTDLGLDTIDEVVEYFNIIKYSIQEKTENYEVIFVCSTPYHYNLAKVLSTYFKNEIKDYNNVSVQISHEIN